MKGCTSLLTNENNIETDEISVTSPPLTRLCGGEVSGEW